MLSLPVAGFTNEFSQTSIHIVGPQQGFSPHVGTLLSMMTWMRNVVQLTVQGLKVADLDYLHDQKSNSIGAMLLHLAATERQYQQKTFGEANCYQSKLVDWDAAMGLGDKGRRVIKGQDIVFYTRILNETRARTVAEFKTRDDAWLMEVDPAGFQSSPTNNYCKWFHVCEHESNHNGQIKWIMSRLPGAKKGND